MVISAAVYAIFEVLEIDILEGAVCEEESGNGCPSIAIHSIETKILECEAGIPSCTEEWRAVVGGVDSKARR